MAKAKTGLNKSGYATGTPKKTRQGSGNGTKYAASSRNSARKAYRGHIKSLKTRFFDMEMSYIIQLTTLNL